jgi:hypothetical protein
MLTKSIVFFPRYIVAAAQLPNVRRFCVSLQRANVPNPAADLHLPSPRNIQ